MEKNHGRGFIPLGETKKLFNALKGKVAWKAVFFAIKFYVATEKGNITGNTCFICTLYAKQRRRNIKRTFIFYRGLPQSTLTLCYDVKST